MQDERFLRWNSVSKIPNLYRRTERLRGDPGKTSLSKTKRSRSRFQQRSKGGDAEERWNPGECKTEFSFWATRFVWGFRRIGFLRDEVEGLFLVENFYFGPKWSENQFGTFVESKIRTCFPSEISENKYANSSVESNR